jgi:lipoprotein-releasing system permease protein
MLSAALSSLRFPRKIAMRYLWSKRSEAFITIITVVSILGVAIGVMVLNMAMAIMTGFQTELKSRIVGTNSHILIRSLDGRMNEWRTIAERIKSVKGVTSVSAFTQHQALIKSEKPFGGERALGLLIRGIENGSTAADQVGSYMRLSPGEELPLFNPPSLVVQRPDGSEDEAALPGIIIGRELQRSLGVLAGSPVSILSPQVSSSPFGLMPRFKRFVVAGVYQSGLIEFESGLAYANLPDAQQFFGMGDGVSGLEVRVANIDRAPEVTTLIMSNLKEVGTGLYAQDWTETNRPLWEALKFERKVYFIVLLLIIVMASFSIVTTLIMLVLEKRKDVAILRTMGATSQAIGLIFFMQGSIIGALGTLLGLLLGVLGCLGLKWYGFPLDEQIFQMSTVPVHMEPLNFIVVGVTAFLISSLATFYPAWRASQLHPSEVLRYE